MYQNNVRVTWVDHAIYAVNPGTGLGNVGSGYALKGPGRYSDRSLFRQVDVPTGR